MQGGVTQQQWVLNVKSLISFDKCFSDNLIITIKGIKPKQHFVFSNSMSYSSVKLPQPFQKHRMFLQCCFCPFPLPFPPAVFLPMQNHDQAAGSSVFFAHFPTALSLLRLCWVQTSRRSISRFCRSKQWMRAYTAPCHSAERLQGWQNWDLLSHPARDSRSEGGRRAAFAG